MNGEQMTAVMIVVGLAVVLAVGIAVPVIVHAFLVSSRCYR